MYMVLEATTHVSAVTPEEPNPRTPETGAARSWVPGFGGACASGVGAVSFCPHVFPLANVLSVPGSQTCSHAPSHTLPSAAMRVTGV